MVKPVESTQDEAEKAAADLRALRMVLSAFPAETVQERRNLKDWMRAVDLGAEALLKVAAHRS